MNVGHAFEIGKSHKVCEDYAYSKIIDDRQCCALISDGCSSSDHTDIGARILVHQAISRFNGNLWFDNEFDRLIAYANSSREGLRLRKESLDVTLLGIFVEGSLIRVFGIGDGFIVFKYGNDKMRVTELEPFSINGNDYPMYLSYRLDEFRINRLIVSDNCVFPRYTEKVDCEIRESGDICGYVFKRSYENNLSIDFVAVFSDGVSTFSDGDGNQIPTNEIINELMLFKGTRGPFVERRMNGFRKKCKREGWTHYDDFSMAVVCLKED